MAVAQARYRDVNGSKCPRPRVLFVGHSPLRGGAELCLDTLLRNVTLPREDVFVIVPWEGPLAQSARAMGYRVDIFPLAWWMNWSHSLWHYKRLLLGTPQTIWRLVRHIKRNRINIVYTNTISIFESAFAARLAGVRHIWHVHEVLRDRSWSRQVLPLPLIKRLIHHLSDRLVFESRSSRTVFEGDKASDRSVVVYNCLRFLASEVSPSSVPGRERCGLPGGAPVVGFIGQFNERKNPLLLIRAVSLIKDLGNAHFVFVGRGPLHAEMVRLIDRLGLSERCRIIDFQEDVRWVFEMIDLLVLPSREESFGLVLVEAGAYGRPVVATRTEGPSEIVVHGETGLLVRPDDPEELAACIEKFLRGAVDAGRMGRAAARRVNALFSARRNTAMIEGIIWELVPSRV
jgi:glycosyltransferase involved in cell wall biosynthesis